MLHQMSSYSGSNSGSIVYPNKREAMLIGNYNSKVNDSNTSLRFVHK